MQLLDGNIDGEYQEESFDATGEELMELARYWLEKKLDLQWEFFTAGRTCNTTLFLATEKRLAEVRRHIGAINFINICREVYAKQEKRRHPESWIVFADGDRQARAVAVRFYKAEQRLHQAAERIRKDRRRNWGAKDGKLAHDR